MIKSISNRIYSDYFMRQRLNEYEIILKKSVTKKFTHFTISEYYKMLKLGIGDHKKCFICRHDIDTDVNTAREFFKIEKKIGVKASYYFRKTSFDIDFMRELNEYGNDVGYHYEEIASFAKKNNIRGKKDIFDNIDTIRNEFYNELSQLEKKIGFKIKSVASHGDFINRKLGIANHLLVLGNEEFKLKNKIIENYDPFLIKSYDIYITDAAYPQFYNPVNPVSILDEYKRICFLTHPKHWRVNFVENTKENYRRLREDIKWKLLSSL